MFAVSSPLPVQVGGGELTVSTMKSTVVDATRPLLWVALTRMLSAYCCAARAPRRSQVKVHPRLDMLRVGLLPVWGTVGGMMVVLSPAWVGVEKEQVTGL